MKAIWIKRSALLAVTAALAAAVAGCGNSGKEANKIVEPAKAVGTQEKAAAPAAAKKTQYPLTVKDATGKQFTFQKAPAKIVSVSPAETEALFDIGLGDQIVGVSDFDDYPAEAKSKPKMGGVTKPNTEAVIAAGADIVFTGVSMKKEAVEQYRGQGINMFKVEPKTLADVMNNVMLYGQITDHQEQAEQVVAKMKADLQKVQDAVKGLKPEERKKVYIEFSPGWTVGKGEFMDELITLAGGTNVAGDTQGWNQISEENIIKANPNIIFYPQGITDDKTKKTLEQIIRERSGWDKIDAIQKNQVIPLDGNLISRPGPRLTDGLLAMAKAMYPDLVK